MWHHTKIFILLYLPWALSESGESESKIGSSAFPDPNLITDRSPTEHADEGHSSGCSYSCGADVVGGLHP